MTETPEDELFLRKALSDLREPCEDHDGGMRACCGTRQLGPHTDNCPKPPSFQAGMAGHERMYWHETEVRE